MATNTTSIMGITLTLALWACDSNPPEPDACCQDEVAIDDPLPDTSIYRLESSWANRTGKPCKLAELRGKISVIAMVFTHCAFACPQILNDIKTIEAELSASALRDVRFVLVSMDSERDTPPVLDAWGKENGLDAGRWTLLHGEAGDVRELAATLGVKFKQQSNGDFTHSNLITVLDPQGRVAHRQTGLNADHAPTVERIESLSH